MFVAAVKNVPWVRVNTVEFFRDDVQVIFTAMKTKMKTDFLTQNQEFANKDQRMPAVHLRTVGSIL